MAIDLEPPSAAAPAQDDDRPRHSNAGGTDDDDDDDDLRSLVRTLADRSAKLAERVALLEGREGAAGENDAATSPPSADWLAARASFDVGKEEGGKGDDEAGGGGTSAATGVPFVAGVVEDFCPDQHGGGGDDDDDVERRITSLEQRLGDTDERKDDLLNERKYFMPESTFTLLITHTPRSTPFVFGILSIALSISCLALTLYSSIQKGVEGNSLGMPAGVDPVVRAAQFLGAMVGVLMEDEIPQGLQIIANGAGHTLLLNGCKPVQKRVMVCSIFRLVVGYLFLSSLFINIAQNDDVLAIFYDVLALEFVENIDDTAFALAKRGFFGRSMLVATNENYHLQIAGRRGERRLSFSGMIASNNRSNLIIRFMYFLNAAIVLIGLGYITVAQKNGRYRCNTFNVLFDEEIWENANVGVPPNGGANGGLKTEERLLIYSTFNGIYKELGSHEGYPKYVEQNKYDGKAPLEGVTGAEIVFCQEISSWVFRHPDIFTSKEGQNENECNWLWRSRAQDQDYDLLSTTNGPWETWIGEVKPLSQVSITCNECSERSDCNYHGDCIDEVCACYDGHFGESCAFELPCEYLASEKANTLDFESGSVEWKQDNPIQLWSNYDGAMMHEVYNRPVYIQKGLSGEPYDMRLYKIREKEKSDSPSSQPTSKPSTSNEPTTIPSKAPSPPPTPFPTWPPTLSMDPTSPPITFPPSPPITFPPYTIIPTSPVTSAVYVDITPIPTTMAPSVSPTTAPPTKPRYSQNEYDTAPDFADWDDFFESQPLHDLEDILEDYNVIISYSGSRFYATIVESNATLEDLFPRDYHAFWSQSFDINRTFIVSDVTYGSSPVGIDFFEMRRRINTLLNPNVQFNYGPFGALIPLMTYEGSGFFHCLNETAQSGIADSELYS